MPIKAKTGREPFVGWPGADGWVGGWVPVLEANRVALDHWTKVSDTMVKGMFAISQEMTQFAHTRLREEWGVFAKGLEKPAKKLRDCTPFCINLWHNSNALIALSTLPLCSSQL
jgi:hypothetical protein